MILKFAVIGLVSALVRLNGANGASYSKVFVQSGGPDAVPVEYYNYGAPPAVVSNTQIARLSAPPVGSVVPVKTVSNVIPPCVSPCVVTAPVASAVPNAKLVTYNSPNVPVVVAPSKDNGYEYSYVVYDENTGDKKAQRELSDGAVVRGEYSFLQPDGYVREVQYRADDLNGFNVVIKRILPESVGADTKTKNPCTIKQEELKVEPTLEKNDGHEGHDHTHDGHDHVHAEPSADQAHDIEVPTHEDIQVKESIVVSEPEKETIQEHENVNESEPEQLLTVEPVRATKPVPDNKPVPLTEIEKVEQVEVNSVAPEVTNQATIETVDQPLGIAAPNLMISYEDVIRCLQAKGLAQNGLNYSPLTYIILPASNRPC